MLTCFHNNRQRTTDNNSGQSDPYVSFLLRQATQKFNFQAQILLIWLNFSSWNTNFCKNLFPRPQFQAKKSVLETLLLKTWAAHTYLKFFWVSPPPPGSPQLFTVQSPHRNKKHFRSTCWRVICGSLWLACRVTNMQIDFTPKDGGKLTACIVGFGKWINLRTPIRDNAKYRDEYFINNVLT